MHAVVGSLYIYPKNPVEFRFGGALKLPNVGDPRTIYEDMKWVLTGEPSEQISYRPLLGDVANMRRGPTTDVHNLTSCAFRSLFINIHEPHPCTFLRKSLRNGLAYAAGGPGIFTGYRSGFPTGEPSEQISSRPLLGDVANMRRAPPPDVHNLTSCAFRSLFINIHEPHPCTFLRKSLRNGLAYAAGGPGNNRRFAVKPLAIGLLRCVRQWKAPPFREMKSRSEEHTSELQSRLHLV